MTKTLFTFLALAFASSACTAAVDSSCADGACDEGVVPAGKADGAGFDWNAPVEGGKTPPLFARIHYPIEFREIEDDGETKYRSPVFESADGNTQCWIDRDAPGTLAGTGPYFLWHPWVPTIAGFETNAVLGISFARNPDGLEYMQCIGTGTLRWSDISNALFDPEQGAFMVLEELPAQTGEPMLFEGLMTYADAGELCSLSIPSAAAPDVEYRLPDEWDAQELFSRSLNEGECVWLQVAEGQSTATVPVASLVDGVVTVSYQPAGERACRGACLPPRF